jgi:hypothetical protein
MAATKKQVDDLFALFESQLSSRGYFLDYDNNRPCLRRHTSSGDVDVSPRLTMTPMFQWLTLLMKGIELAQTPLPIASKCPVCDGKLEIYEALPTPKWTYLCSNCEETGTILDLNDLALARGE